MLHRLLIGLAVICIGAVVLFVALVELATKGKPFPLDDVSRANQSLVERLFAADHPASDALELPCLAMQRHVSRQGKKHHDPKVAVGRPA